MNVLFTNSKFSTLSFRKDWQACFDIKTCYLQKIAVGEEIRIQFTSVFTQFEAKYVNENENETPVEITPLITIGENTLFEVVFTINTPGSYRFELRKGTFAANTYFIVKPKDELTGTILLSYTHRKNDFDAIFTGKKFNFRVEGGIYQGNKTQSVENEIFRDQRFNPSQTSATAYEVSVLTIGSPEGVPQWIGNKINHIFCLSDVEVDGIRSVRNESSTSELISTGVNNPLYVHKISIEQPDEDIYTYISNGLITLSLSKTQANFHSAGGTDTVTVHITGADNNSFSLENIPHWISYTINGMDINLSCQENNDDDRLTSIVVRSNADPSVSALLTVAQEAAGFTTQIELIYNTALNQTITTAAIIESESEFQIDWGDGSEIETHPGGETVETPYGHTFLTAGNKTVKIQGNTIVSAKFNAAMTESAYALDGAIIAGIRKFKSSTITDMSNVFNGQTNLVVNTNSATHFAFDVPNSSTYAFAFRDCTSITTTLPFMFGTSALGLGQVKFLGTFFGSGITAIDSNTFTGANPGPFQNAFWGCSSLVTVGADVFQNVKESLEAAFMPGGSGGGKNILFMETFKLCESLVTIPDSLFDDMNIYRLSFHGCFNNCTSLTNVPRFRRTQVVEFQMCFYKCQALVELPDNYLGASASDPDRILLSDFGWIMADGMFGSCYNLEANLDTLFSDWLVSKIGLVGFFQVKYGMFDGKDGGDDEPPKSVQPMKIASSNVQAWIAKLTGLISEQPSPNHCFRGCSETYLTGYNSLPEGWK